MNSKPTAVDHTTKLENLTELKNQQMQRNQELIEASLQKISNLKMARLEMKYFVACSLDYLGKTMPQLSAKEKQDPTIIDFNNAKARLISNRTTSNLEKSRSLNYKLSSYLSPGSK
jgi:hypothetical protein